MIKDYILICLIEFTLKTLLKIIETCKKTALNLTKKAEII